MCRGTKILVKALEQNTCANEQNIFTKTIFVKNIFQLQQLRSSHQLLGAREAPPDYTTVINRMMTMVMMVVVMVIVMALTQIPISTFSHIWAFVCRYGIMFVIIVIIITIIIVILIIIIIIYRKVKVSTLKHV